MFSPTIYVTDIENAFLDNVETQQNMVSTDSIKLQLSFSGFLFFCLPSHVPVYSLWLFIFLISRKVELVTNFYFELLYDVLVYGYICPVITLQPPYISILFLL